MKRKYTTLTGSQRVQVYQEVARILNEGRKPPIGKLVDEVKAATGFDNITYGNLHKILKRMFKRRYSPRRKKDVRPIEVPLNTSVDDNGQVAWTFPDPRHTVKVGELNISYTLNDEVLNNAIQLAEMSLKMLKEWREKSA